MVEVFVIVYCPVCTTHWEVDAEPLCTETAHEHMRHEAHRHQTPVTLPDGTSVIAVSFDGRDPYRRDAPPDHGLYLDPRWSPPWDHDHVDWPDFGVPADIDALLTSLRAVLDRARGGERIEIGCLGAHGRTGTALACLAVLTGCAPADAVDWVRTTYCPHAVETDEQAALVANLSV